MGGSEMLSTATSACVVACSSHGGGSCHQVVVELTVAMMAVVGRNEALSVL